MENLDITLQAPTQAIPRPEQQILRPRKKAIPAPDRTMILTEPEGFLAGRIIQAANFIAHSRETGSRFYNPGFDSIGYGKYFAFSGKDPWITYPPGSRPSFLRNPMADRTRRLALVKWLAETKVFSCLTQTHEGLKDHWGLLPESYALQLENNSREICNLDDPEEILMLAGRKVKYLVFGKGKFRSVDSFDRHASELRRIFTPRSNYMDRINLHMQSVRKTQHTLVGVHFRGGDYRESRGGLFFYDIPELLDRMRKVKDLLYPDPVRFMICSNENLDPALFEEFDVVFGPGHELEDLYSLAKCDLIMGPPSRYTAWASFWGMTPVHHFRRDGRIGLGDFNLFDQEEFLKLDNRLGI